MSHGINSTESNPFNTVTKTLEQVEVKVEHLLDDKDLSNPNKRFNCNVNIYNVARIALGISLACITVGVLIVYFPAASHIFFCVLATASALSISYLIYHAVVSCRAASKARKLEQIES